ncbi:DNA polymerase III subunit gamma/tau [Psychromonas sp. MME1]|uniref:DNA polymerase III subunit gamma/tau n=1 Tax=Psychromonas sp. MME1 TaxID=3231032 RepID=UPI0034E28811
MSYQVLARKWRPRNFQEVIGQSHVLTALSNGLARNRVHHAYLFSGTRGVGKTTIARILSKSLNCEQGVTATPCGQCVNCQAIDQGRFVDLLEIDAASRTKVDDTRELLDNVQYKPAQGRYKVYLIDEVHMLSKHSFNALLKTLEEPPEYVKFLLATTDPQKLPITVLSRCLQFHLKALLPDEIEKQLNFILQQEQAVYEHAAITVIAKAADGSMRDALSLTDQALAFGAGNIEYQSVLKMLGTIDNAHLVYLLHFIVSGNTQKVFQKIEEFVHLGADFAKLHQELAGLCHQLALLQMQGKKHDSNKTAMQLLAERLSPEEVQLYYQIALQGYKDYPYAPNGKIALEMTVMRLLAFKPANYIAVDETQLDSAVLAKTPEPKTTTFAPVSDEIAIHQSEQSEASLPADTALAESPSNETARAADASLAEDALPDATHHNLPENNVVEEPYEQQSVQQVTHSRNMLRSHRQKREEAKKSQAATNSPIIADVVAQPQDSFPQVNLPETEKNQEKAPGPSRSTNAC